MLRKAKEAPVGDVKYDPSRYSSVIERVAEMAEWGLPKPEGIYQGIGAHYSFGSYVAQIADVSIHDAKIKVHKVYCAVDCGVVVNMSGAETMIEGGIIDGLGHALYGELNVENGMALQTNFDSYHQIRMRDVPEIVVEFQRSEASPRGLGEPGLPPIAAAVGNALFAATGQRIRQLPFVKSFIA